MDFAKAGEFAEKMEACLAPAGQDVEYLDF